MSVDASSSFHILFIGPVWPEPTSTAAGYRIGGMIDYLQMQSWKVSFASAAKENAFSDSLKSRGVNIFPVQPNDASFDQWIRELSPDFVLFDRFMTEEQFGWRVHEACPQTVRILDTSDLHFLRRARGHALQSHSLEQIASASIPLQTEDALREVASIYRSDLTLMISDFEMEILTGRFGLPKELIFLHRLSYPKRINSVPNLNERKHFVMIGNFRHLPNRDAFFWMKDKIWPLIRQELDKRGMKDVELHCYGSYPPKEVMDCDHEKTGFRVKGWTPDQFHTLSQYRVSLAPLRFGAGIKGKIADSWYCGTPVVTTPIGSEGMHGALEFSGRVAQSEEQFAQASVDLYRDPETWHLEQEQGHRLIRDLYDSETLNEGLLSQLVQARQVLGQRREKNFVGQMLLHHLSKSTKYFSKWIEEKNKKGMGK